MWKFRTKKHFRGYIEDAYKEARRRGMCHRHEKEVFEVGWVRTEVLPTHDMLEEYILHRCDEGTKIDIVGTVTMRQYDEVMMAFKKRWDTTIFYVYREDR